LKKRAWSGAVRKNRSESGLVINQHSIVNFTAACGSLRPIRKHVVVGLTCVACVIPIHPARASQFLQGPIDGLHFGNSQTHNSLPENLSAEFLAMGASEAYVETYLGSGTPLDVTIQPEGTETAQGEIQGRTWSYITMQPGLLNGNMYGQSQFEAAEQIVQWGEAAGQHPIYYVYQAWPFYSPIGGWGQAPLTGPWPVVSTYSDIWNRPPDTFTVAQFFQTNASVFNYLGSYFDIFIDQLRADFPQEIINIIPVGEVFARLDGLLLATNGIPPDGPTSVTGAWSFVSQSYGDGILANPLGEYVAHVTTLSTITGINPKNLPVDISAYPGLALDEKGFLDGVIWDVITSDPRTGLATKLGAQVYFLPDTPNGLKPTQSWDAVGSTPSGDIYVAGMDHVSNAALYRFRPSRGTLQYVGDARSASEAANNWLPGEAVQKFHTRPLWYKGKVYVATLNYSNLDDNYLKARGFKWYVYDEALGLFTDLSAAVPGGTAIDKGGILALTLSPTEQKFYAMTVPTADLVSYDPLLNLTTVVGRPSQFNKPYVYSTRFLWVDSHGRIYLSAGNPAWAPQTGTPDDPGVFGHVYFYDAGQGFGEHTDWPLVNTTAIQSGQWTLDRRFCYMMDDQANVFVFDDSARSLSWLGQVPLQAAASWVFQLCSNGKRIYVIEGRHDSAGRIFEFDLGTLQSQAICSLTNLVPSVTRGDVCGFDSWDTDGRFYITSGDGQTNVAFIQIDPVLVKFAFGFLPSVTQVEIGLSTSVPDSFSIIRHGDTSQPCSVVYSARVPYNPSVPKQFYSAIIPAGQTNLDLPFPSLFSSSGAAPRVISLDVVPDGDTYKAGVNRSLTVSLDAFNQATAIRWTSVAGGQGSGSSDGYGGAAFFNQPTAVTADSSGNVYIADTGNHTIRKLAPSGQVMTLAGSAGSAGSTDGMGSNALFNSPAGIAVDAVGTMLYISDTGNHTLRQLVLANQNVSTLAGLAGNIGSDDGTGSAARFYNPQGAVLSSSGDLFLADTSNEVVRRITPGGAVSTLAGIPGVAGSANGLAQLSSFNEPHSLALDPGGNLYISDRLNYVVRKLSTDGQVSTFVGQGVSGANDGPGGSAQFARPQGLGLDATGYLFVADTWNHTIRKISSAGWVTTVGGNPGTPGDSDGVGSAAQFNNPVGLAVAADGSIYVADSSNNRIVRGTAFTPILDLEQPSGVHLANGDSRDYGAMALGGFADLTFTLKNNGDADLSNLALWIDGDDASAFSLIAYPSSSVSGSGGSTAFTARFSPLGRGVKNAVLHVASNDPLASPFSINLTGTALGPVIVVEQAPGTTLSNGDGNIDFGAVPVGGAADLPITIKNAGNAELNGIAVFITNSLEAAFAVATEPGSAVVAPGGSTTFTIRFTPLSAGAKTATVRISSNDPLESPFYINLTGTIAAPSLVVQQPPGLTLINWSVFDFGAVPLAQSASVSFSISNSGNADLAGLSLLIDGPDAASFVIPNLPGSTVIPAGGSTVLAVQFTPINPGAKTAVLHITSNDPLNNPFNIALTGLATAAAMLVEQPSGTPLTNTATVAFGSVPVGSSNSLSFTIRNTGNANLTGIGITEDGPSASEFAVTAGPMQPVLPGGTTVFAVQFTPSSAGVRSANLHLASNDPFQNPFSVVLNGVGTTGSGNSSDVLDGPLLTPAADAVLLFLIGIIGSFFARRS